jgi:dihydropteroate synthase
MHTHGRCLVMGILNVTPDSFSDGGRYATLPGALDQAAKMAGEGADIIDVGGESTRPGSAPVGLNEELDRVIPVIRKLAGEIDVTISVDTSKAEVMHEAVAAGAMMINDVRALQGEAALDTAAELKVPVCLMHMLGDPRTMQSAPTYVDVVDTVIRFLNARIDAAMLAGIAREDIIIDPGFGFGKTLAHNLQLFQALDRIVEMGCRVMVGVSRKSMLGELLDKPVEQRVYGGLALAVLAQQRGVAMVRVHDVAPTVDALKVAGQLAEFG